ncbi:unnamed protein product [Chilo suppressalis]|uniref:Lysozyme n=1 Tax=Chilo suppressalis TaxID=168631 RepID=A0ABN8EDF6_CHISP|nr:unnamed protein product [Chilo suppressalis]
MARFNLKVLSEFYLILHVYTITFSRCQLARELILQGFPRQQLENWVCLVEGESSGRTDVIGGPDSDGSYDHGLFQINDRYWCDHNRPGKGCNVLCADLRLDNISIASQCAKEIYKQSGFDAWVAWRRECRGELPNLHRCGF